MRRLTVIVALACLGVCRPVLADLASPATLQIDEVSPSSFQVELKLPVVKGRVAKVLPVLPAEIVPAGEPELQGDGLRVVQTWTMECAPSDLLGVPIGVKGLLGSSLEVRLTVTMLDGRQLDQPLRPRQPFAVIPPPPGLVRLAGDAGRAGIHRAARRPELILIFVLAVLLSLRTRSIAAGLLAFAVSHAFGGWLAGEQLLLSSPGVPRILATLTAVAAALAVISAHRRSEPDRFPPLWPALLPIGLLYGAVAGGTGQGATLSRLEQHLELVFFAAGAAATLGLVAVAARQLRAAGAGLSEDTRRRLEVGAGYVAGALACAVGLYEASALAFGRTLAPEVPVIALAAALTLGLWSRARAGRPGGALAMAALPLLAGGIFLSFQDVRLPLPGILAFGGLAWLGGSLLTPALLGRWPGSAVAVVTALVVGNVAGWELRESTSLPPAHALGSVAVIAFALLAGYRACPRPADGRVPGIAKFGGALAVLLAILYRAGDHGEWLAGPFVVARAMGRFPLPVLALCLLLAACIVWPRKRRFQAEGAVGPGAAHWLLLGAAFFLLPIGVLRVKNPFHDQAVPSPAVAGKVMDGLLTDTYLAFNLADEDKAIDRLEDNLSPDLVADVYLDSRRRLRAGTREGSSVTVKGVDIVSVTAGAAAADGSAFTYPCSWVVTARVKHRQHIHDRRNVYVGEVTIRVEGDRWRIFRLALTSEEREVLASWKR